MHVSFVPSFLWMGKKCISPTTSANISWGVYGLHLCQIIDDGEISYPKSAVLFHIAIWLFLITDLSCWPGLECMPSVLPSLSDRLPIPDRTNPVHLPLFLCLCSSADQSAYRQQSVSLYFLQDSCVVFHCPPIWEWVASLCPDHPQVCLYPTPQTFKQSLPLAFLPHAKEKGIT